MTFKFWGHRKVDVLQHPVYRIPGTREYMTWKNKFNGSLCLGSNGSGKSSGPGFFVLDKMLRDESRPGGLILCVKQDDRIRYERMIENAGRTQDLVILSHDQYTKFNAISYELNRLRNGSVNYDSVVDILVEIFLLG